jgi:hypothetical protein
MRMTPLLPPPPLPGVKVVDPSSHNPNNSNNVKMARRIIQVPMPNLDVKKKREMLRISEMKVMNLWICCRGQSLEMSLVSLPLLVPPIFTISISGRANTHKQVPTRHKLLENVNQAKTLPTSKPINQVNSSSMNLPPPPPPLPGRKQQKGIEWQETPTYLIKCK